jgi:hypothetical protein
MLRIAGSVLHILSQTAPHLSQAQQQPSLKGQKAAQERFSEESFRPSHHQKRVSQTQPFGHAQTRAINGTQQAWINSRNLLNITTEVKHRQLLF